MGKLIDLTGQKFGRLTVVKREYIDGEKSAVWGCICDCDGITYKKVRASHLKSGVIMSCGCIRDEKLREKSIKHGLSNTRIFTVWQNMKSRCYNKNNKKYNNYGGRGVKVCDEWLNNFQNFYDWAIANKENENLEIDRIDTNGDYSPENCRWVTQEENKSVGRTNMSSHNTSGYVGVCHQKKSDGWVASITHNKKRVYVGHFKFIEDAVEARINKEIELFGEQRTNFHYNKN